MSGGPGEWAWGESRPGTGIAAKEEDHRVWGGRGVTSQYVTECPGGVRRCYQKSSREHGETGRGECMEILVKV